VFPAAFGTAIHLIGNRQNIRRIAPMLDKAYTSLDGLRDLPIVKGLGAEQARHHKPDLAHFFAAPAERFTPLRAA
jgi:hypothetical protein